MRPAAMIYLLDLYAKDSQNIINRAKEVLEGANFDSKRKISERPLSLSFKINI